jgi:citrate lyase beta subunit
MTVDDLVAKLDSKLGARLARADADLASQYPGDRGVRQPVHTVYIPADGYDADTVSSWGERALEQLDACADVLGAPAEVRERVRAKLESEPIEDLRIDFEDGYGNRPDDEEDDAVRRIAQRLPATPYFGIRFKSFEAPTRTRGLRTLALFVAEAGVPPVVTLPKVTSVDQVEAMVLACECIEAGYGVEGLRFEIQVETPQSILGPDGTALVARMIHAAQGRCTGLHYGTYDYSASCGIAAAYQSMEHPAADHAKAAMQVAAAGTGVFLSDGSTNVMPVGNQAAEAWRLHARLVRRSLERGFYQGWDLHPAQLPSRFLATYDFYREGLPTAAKRLEAYVDGGDSGYLDEPATAAALAGFVLRGIECGAVGEDEIGVERPTLARLARRPE